MNLLSTNLEFIAKTYSAELASLLSDSAKHVKIDCSKDNKTRSLYIDNTLCSSDLDSEIQTYSSTNFNSYSTIRLARPSYSGYESSSPSELAGTIRYSDDDVFLPSFRSLNSDNLVKTQCFNDYILVGSLALQSLVADHEKNLQNYENVNTITLIETDLKYLAATLSSIDFEKFISYTKERNIKFKFIFSSSANDIKELLYKYLLESCILSFHGFRQINAFVHSNELLEVKSWLQSTSGIAHRLLASIGFSTDELNQLSNCIGNLKSYPSSLDPFPLDLSKQFLVVGGGPSLSANIETLKQNASKFSIVAAGSSVATLLKAGIQPNFLVILERSEAVYTALRDLSKLFPCLNKITLIVANTCDPRIPDLFEKKIFYDRTQSVSSLLLNSAETNDSQLMGPEASNAAFEYLLSNGVTSVALLGCDFGAPTPSKYRSDFALGDSPRVLDVPVFGNFNKTVYSEPMFLFAKDAFQAIFDKHIKLSNNQIKVSRVGEGVRLRNIDNYSSLSDYFSKCNYTASSAPLSLINNKAIKSDSIDKSLHELSLAMNKIFNTIKDRVLSSSHCSSELTNFLSSQISPTLRYRESTYSSSELSALKLYRHPLIYLYANLYHSSADDWELITTRMLDDLKLFKDATLIFISNLNQM